MTDDALVVIVALPGGSAGAFSMQTVMEAQRRAAELGLSMPASSTAPTTAERLLDSKAMAELLGVGDTTVEAMARDGRVPSVRIGKALRFEPRAVLAALRVNRERL